MQKYHKIHFVILTSRQTVKREITPDKACSFAFNVSESVPSDPLYVTSARSREPLYSGHCIFVLSRQLTGDHYR